MATYAVVQTGGKQYRVAPGEVVRAERVDAGEGDRVALEDVRLLSRDGEVTVGSPRVEGARVVAEVEEHGRGEKQIVFKFRHKNRYRRKQGHRQPFTALRIVEIEREGAGSPAGG